MKFICILLLTLPVLTSCKSDAQQNLKIYSTIDSLSGVKESLSLEDSNDFAVANLTENMDSADVVKILGEPEQILEGDYELNNGNPLYTLMYKGIAIHLNSTGKVLSFELSDTNYSTARGLKVKDSLQKLYKLYGEPQSTAEEYNQLYYNLPDDELHIVRVEYQDSIIKKIYIGRLLD